MRIETTVTITLDTLSQTLELTGPDLTQATVCKTTDQLFWKIADLIRNIPAHRETVLARWAEVSTLTLGQIRHQAGGVRKQLKTAIFRLTAGNPWPLLGITDPDDELAHLLQETLSALITKHGPETVLQTLIDASHLRKACE